MVETSQADNFTVRRTFTLEMGNGDFGAFSVAKEAAVMGHVPRPVPCQIPLCPMYVELPITLYEKSQFSSHSLGNFLRYKLFADLQSVGNFTARL